MRYEGASLNSAVQILQLINVTHFIFTIVCGYLVDRKLNTLTVMIFGNVCFYAGCILAYGSTTEFLNVPFGYEIGLVLAGFGDAATLNLCIMSKFVLYEKWGVRKGTLGRRASATFNLILNMSYMLGIYAAGLTPSRESEIPTVVLMVVFFIVGTAGLFICKIVK